MAKINRKISNLKRNMLVSLQKSAGALIATVLTLGATGYLFGRFGSPWFFLLLLIVPVQLYMMQKYWTMFHVYKQGQMGEKEVVSCLKKLPDSYAVYTSVVLKSHYGKKETDQIVVGPTGVFLLETKNYRGEVSGKGGTEPWKLIKTSNAGRRYENHIPSPVRQIREQQILLQGTLSNAALNVEPRAFVVFGKDTTLHAQASPEVLVALRDGGCQNLLDLILNGEDRLDDKTLQSISKVLTALK